MIYIGVLIINISQPESGVHRPTFVPFPVPEPYRPQPGDILVTCEICGWQNIYQEIAIARRGIAGHRGWCKRKAGEH